RKPDSVLLTSYRTNGVVWMLVLPLFIPLFSRLPLFCMSILFLCESLNKINLNEISYNSAMGLIKQVIDMGVLLTEVYLDTVVDPEKY
ncbi:hypothetical protein HID58_082896, partial [Brassica napus]